MNDLLAMIKAQAQDLTGELSALRRDFHQHPELSHQEERTARVVESAIGSRASSLPVNVRPGQVEVVARTVRPVLRHRLNNGESRTKTQT